jgi:hypothetical protein
MRRNPGGGKRVVLAVDGHGGHCDDRGLLGPVFGAPATGGVRVMAEFAVQLPVDMVVGELVTVKPRVRPSSAQ